MRLSSGSVPSAVRANTTAGGGSGVNVSVTDVAWSLPQSYIAADDEHNVIHVGIGGVSPDGDT
eukprot:scaffold21250_cov70-Cyclotella_meneghiniana.AAC.7